MSDIKLAVIGAGHQGRNHLRSLQGLPGFALAAVVDRQPDRADAAAKEFGGLPATEYSEVISSVDAAVIAIPTSLHFEVAKAFIDKGKHVLIEKPVTQSIDQAERLQELAASHGVIVHVGFPERFNPAVEEARARIVRPMFIETHRLGMFSPRSLDVDVVFDLMIHDLDLLHSFLKEDPSSIEAVGVPILSHNIDIANVRLRFPSGCVVNLTASRVSMQRMRKMRIFQPFNYISIDFAQQMLSVVRVEPSTTPGEFPQIYPDQFTQETPAVPLAKELSAFRDAILNGNNASAVTIQDAIPSLRTAIAIKNSFAPLPQ